MTASISRPAMYLLVVLVVFVLGSQLGEHSDSRVVLAQEEARGESQLVWKQLNDYGLGVDAVVHRAKVPGGWLVSARLNTGTGPANVDITFYPDAEHQWSGVSIQ